MAPARKLTINGIARLAGVSKGTVSKVLNNYKGVNEATRRKILDIIRDMDFEPNQAARTLVSRETGNIGLIIPHPPEVSLTGAYWSSLVSEIAKEATRCDYSLVLLLPQAEGHLPEVFRSALRKKRVDGFVIGAELLDKHSMATLISSETPFVMLGQNRELEHHCVDVDNRQAAASITEYVVARGYRRPIFVGGPPEYAYVAEREEGFRGALRARGIEAIPPLSVPYEDRSALERAIHAVVAETGPDSAILGAGGGFMCDAYDILAELGLHPPAFGFATFDDYRFLEFIRPPITAVSQPVGRLGMEAVRILVGLFHTRRTGSQPIQRVILPTTIIPRESCGEKDGAAPAQPATVNGAPVPQSVGPHRGP